MGGPHIERGIIMNDEILSEINEDKATSAWEMSLEEDQIFQQLNGYRSDIKLLGRYKCGNGMHSDVCGPVYVITRFSVPMCKGCFVGWRTRFDYRR